MILSLLFLITYFSRLAIIPIFERPAASPLNLLLVKRSQLQEAEDISSPHHFFLNPHIPMPSFMPGQSFKVLQHELHQGKDLIQRLRCEVSQQLNQHKPGLPDSVPLSPSLVTTQAPPASPHRGASTLPTKQFSKLSWPNIHPPKTATDFHLDQCLQSTDHTHAAASS